MSQEKTALLFPRAMFRQRTYVFALAVLLLIPAFITAPYILSDAENPEGVIQYPSHVDMQSEGFLLVILDGVGRDFLSNREHFPAMHSSMKNAAVLEITTGPLTLSATCISELMTGVPNNPVDGLKNFNLGHPGGTDPWLLSHHDPRYSVGMIGSYVMGNLYADYPEIDFIDTFKGHGDFYEGDEDTELELLRWLDEGEKNVIAAHFSGPDKVGHKWGIKSQEYSDKIEDLDKAMVRILNHVPENWTVVITADHGMTDSGSHGSAEQVTREVSALITGPDVSLSARIDVHQRDVPALMATILELPFPVQLDGKIPLIIFNLDGEQKAILDQWNWDAAVKRNEFYQDEYGKEFQPLSQDFIDWDSVSSDSTFVRNFDQNLSLLAWGSMVFLSMSLLGVHSFRKRKPQFDAVLFCGVIGFSLWSHVNLSSYPMVHRFTGGVFAVGLISWPFLKAREDSKGVDALYRYHVPFSAFSRPQYWLLLFLFIFLFTLDFSTATSMSSFLWIAVACLDVFGLTNYSETKEGDEGAPVLFFLAAVSFASLRLWFALIPLFFIVLKLTAKAYDKKKSNSTFVPLLSLSLLIFVALISVHRRIFNAHWLLELARAGWSDSLETWFFSILIIALGSMVCVFSIHKRWSLTRWAQTSSWLVLSLTVQILGSTNIDRLFLAVSLACLVLVVLNPRAKMNNALSKQCFLSLLAGFTILTWGTWTGMITLVLLSILPTLIQVLFKNPETPFQSNTRMYVALTIIPWAVWILWWTSLGQVNGLQTCIEGICPHPRELDPGVVMVRGGYVGSRINPSTGWMTLMIVLPLVLSSSALFYQFCEQNVSVKPYVIGQLLLILGCLNMYAFSPEFPRLIYNLTWNILFAAFQMLCALLAVMIYQTKNTWMKFTASASKQ